MGKLYAFFYDGMEETEAVTTVDILRRAGVDVTTVSLTGNATVCNVRGIKIVADKLYSEINVPEADAVFMPGGEGWERYHNYPEFLQQVKIHCNAGKITAAICAAPVILSEIGLLKGRRATCYPTLSERLIAGGASYVQGEITVTDGNIITAPGPGTTPYFALEVVRATAGGKAADAVKKGFILPKGIL